MHPVPGRSCLLLMLLAPLAAQGSQGRLDFSLQDLVRASGGRLGILAWNLATGRKVALNAGRSFRLGSQRGLILAAATLTLSAPGVRGTTPSPPQEQLLEEVLWKERRQAADLLLKRLGVQGLRSWMRDRGLAGFGLMTGFEDQARSILRRVDKKLASLPRSPLERWFYQGEHKALVPAFLKEDPRMNPLLARRLRNARAAFHAEGRDIATPEALARFMGALLEGRLLSKSGTTRLLRLLAGAPRPQLGEELPLHLRVLGLDSRLTDQGSSTGIIFTDPGPVVMSVHADDYAWRPMVQGFLSKMGRAALLDVAPECATPRHPVPAPPRSLLGSYLLPLRKAEEIGLDFRSNPDRGLTALAEAATEVFRQGQRPALVLVFGSEVELHPTLRWFLPDGRHQTERRVCPAGLRVPCLFKLGAGAPTGGHYTLRAALEGKIFLEKSFQLLLKKRSSPHKESGATSPTRRPSRKKLLSVP